MLFKKGWYVALVGEGEGEGDDDLNLWYATCKQNVSEKTNACHVEWLEQVGSGEYVKSGILDIVPADSLLGRIAFKEKEKLTDSRKKLLLSPKSGRLAARMFAEKTGAEIQQEEQEEEKKALVSPKKEKASRKRKLETAGDKKNKKKVANKKSGNRDKKIKIKKEKKEKKIKIKKEKKVKEPKPKKVKVDKSNPNWRLKPNLKVKVWEKDPLFETKVDVPFVSSSAHSRLVIRAVLLRDTKLLNQYIKDTERIWTIWAKRSMACQLSGLKYALKNEDMESVKIFWKAFNEKQPAKRCSREACLLPVHGTGAYNYRSLGIRHVRRVNLSRGSREGNNAFTKDRDVMEDDRWNLFNASDLMGWNLSSKFVSSLASLTKKANYEFTGHIYEAMRTGNTDLSVYYINKDLAQGSQQFSKFFIDALTGSGDPWEGKIREASARKKADDNRHVTTLHAACLNKDSGPLEAMLQVCPDLYLSDLDHWKLVHYAAVAEGTAALELLLSRGVPTEDPTKDGFTPLLLASKTGRFRNVDIILKHNSQNDPDEDSILLKKFGRGMVNKPAKNSWAPVHFATSNCHLEVLRVLVNYGADMNKHLNTTYDKMTPLMLAAASGELDLVKFLVKYAKVEKKDRYKRTALTHAVINGNAHVASYLLSLGSDVNSVDSSGNSNLHYACAYGWWFCMQVLLEAGAHVNAANEWKLTPLSAAILKGNTGIGKHLSTLPGVDLEVRDDQGRTILLNMLIDNAEGLTNAKVAEIKSFVDDYKADPHTADNSGRNALHYVAEIRPQSHDQGDMAAFFRNAKELLNFFLERGVSPNRVDNAGRTPLQLALKNSFQHSRNNGVCCEAKPPFTRIGMYLKAMLKAVKKGDQHLDMANSRLLMRDFFSCVELKHSKDYNNIYVTLMEIMEVVFNSDLSQLDEVCTTKVGGGEESNTDKSWTVFSELCTRYAEARIDNQNEIGGEEQSKKLWKLYSDIFINFHDSVRPRHSFAVTDKQTFHCLLTLCVAHDDYRALGHLLKVANTDVNVVNGDSKDALYLLIERGRVDMAKEMLDRGAEVNRVRTVKKDDKGKVVEQDTPLLWAIGFGNPDMVELLLSRGADVHTKQSTGCVSSVHKAATAYASQRMKSRLRIVQAVLDHGADVDEPDENGRTALHKAVNCSSDGSDFSMELEMLLLRRGASLSAIDIRGRTPLHYAFVKIGRHTDSSSLDPIQVVSALVEEMSVDSLNRQDAFGASALHYAAFRGATVCLLLMLQKGAEIESADSHQQTPLCYAARGKHDGSALMLIQRDANLNVKMKEGHSLFQGILANDWLGITFITLNKMERFGMQYVEAVEVALRLHKVQFAKSLVSKVVDQTKLNMLASNERNLVSAFAYETPRTTSASGLENIEDLYELLTSAGLDVTQTDAWGCRPLQYALLNNNQALVNLLLKEESVYKTVANGKTKTGRTTFAASIWCLDKFDNLVLTNVGFLIALKCNVNETFCVPSFNFMQGECDLQLTKENFVKTCNLEERDEDAGRQTDVSMTSLHLAVLKQDLELVKLLLEKEADPSLRDSNGLTPLNYALKTNNEKLVTEVLKNTEGKLTVDDLRHAIALHPERDDSPSFDNDKMFQKLLLRHDLLQAGEAEGLLSLAYKFGATSILKVLTGNKKNYRNNNDEPMQVCNSEISKCDVSYEEDSKAMLQKINREYKPKAAKQQPKEKTRQKGCVVKDGHIHTGFDVLMSKVDVTSGRWGMYNFYRMQIWKDANKDLYVLFTNWGRIDRYSHGQYQNTPYSKPEEAEEEFRKIFRAKSGNDWSSDGLDNFVNKPGKYRLVNKELAADRRPGRGQIQFQLKTRLATGFSVPANLAHLIRDVADVAMIKRAYAEFGKVDQESMPFGRIDRDTLVRAKAVLVDELRPLVKKKDALDRKVFFEGQNEKMQALVEGISHHSSEYYSLVPQDGFAYERLVPLDNEHDLNQEIQKMDYLLDVSYTEKLLLGAMYRRQEIHPLDYIYSGLRCGLRSLDLEDTEARLIIKYINRSRGAKQFKVWSIFSLESGGPCDKLKTGQVKLLWHGTKRSNILSILHNSLVTEPAYSHRTGRAFGDGIYLADVFDKSISYCDNNGNRYLLLCEVNMSGCVNHEKRKAGDPVAWVKGQHAPDDRGTVRTVSGYSIPLGKVVPTPRKDNEWIWTQYSEYVVYSSSSIRVKYLVCIKDKYNDKEVTRDEIVEAFKSSDGENDENDVVESMDVEEDAEQSDQESESDQASDSGSE